MSPRVKSALVLCGVFLLGAVTGGGLERARTARREQEMVEAPQPAFRQRQILRGLERAVDLDDAQRERVRAILDQHAVEAQEMRREVGPKLDELRGRMMDDIRGVMRPEQLPRYEKFVERVKARERKARPPREPR